MTLKATEEEEIGHNETAAGSGPTQTRAGGGCLPFVAAAVAELVAFGSWRVYVIFPLVGVNVSKRCEQLICHWVGNNGNILWEAQVLLLFLPAEMS